jgi:hypothetical protein
MPSPVADAVVVEVADGQAGAECVAAFCGVGTALSWVQI